MFTFVVPGQYHAHHHHVHEYEPCSFTADFSTVENSLRSFIFKGETEKAAAVLSSNQTRSLGAGLVYDDEQTCLVTESSVRTCDPDIVAIQVRPP